MAKKIGVVLSGCGVYDGAEIHESVLTLLTISKLGHRAVCMAPDVPQMHVVNHLTGKPAEGESRNVLVESARIARGEIQDIAKVHAKDIDAVVFPGGFGAAKNLSTFAVDGADCDVNPEVSRLIAEMRAAKKPICAICIAPAMLAKASGGGVKVTIGTDAGTAANVEKTGATHVNCPVSEFVVDADNKMVTTPAYMLAKSIAEAAVGIEKAVKATIDLI
ncbi:MAG: isoprenoid biosynthesis glyoxalase ElbB [Planctomycetes bacterium]|nr:isoprenoid biosynthesis glyoxalase ElbB [Planctomycetota bacterium]